MIREVTRMAAIQLMLYVSVKVSRGVSCDHRHGAQTLLSYETCSLVVSSSIKEFPLKYLERMILQIFQHNLQNTFNALEMTGHV